MNRRKMYIGQMNSRFSTISLTLLSVVVQGVYADEQQAIIIGLLAGFVSCFLAITGLCIIFHFYCNVHDHKNKQQKTMTSTRTTKKKDGRISNMHYLRQPPPDPVFQMSEVQTKRTNPMKFF